MWMNKNQKAFNKNILKTQQELFSPQTLVRIIQGYPQAFLSSVYSGIVYLVESYSHKKCQLGALQTQTAAEHLKCKSQVSKASGRLLSPRLLLWSAWRLNNEKISVLSDLDGSLNVMLI